MKKFLITLVLLMFTTSAFAGQACCAKKAACQHPVFDNVITVGIDNPQDDLSVQGYYWGYDRLNLFGPESRVGLGGRMVSYNKDGSAILGSVTFRLADSLYGVLEGGNRHVGNEDLDVVNGGVLWMLAPRAGGKVTAGAKSITLGVAVGF